MSHKKTALVAILVIGVGVYGLTSMFDDGESETRSIVATAKRGSVVSKVTGSGQVTAMNEVEVTSTVSGDVEYVGVSAGQEVKSGQVLATIDSRDAVKAVDNAELALANAQIAYDKALKQKANQAEDSSVSDLKKAYENGYDAITGTFIDLPAIFMDVSDIFYVPSRSPYFSDIEIRQLLGGSSAISYKYQAGLLFDKAKGQYDESFADYKTLSANSSPEDISAFLDVTYALLRDLSAALTGTYSTIDYINARVVTTPSEMSTDKSLLSSYISKVNGNITSVSNSISAIEDAKDSAASSELSLKSAELTLNQQEDALQEAQETLADHSIRAPFDGVISKVPVEKGDRASANTAIATLITKSQNVVLSFNEVDASKLRKGQKATLTFDAIDDLTLSGTVTDIDVVGAVSQGVVSYGVEIGFDTNDDRIKPGMTVSASITADSRENVISIPSSAIRYQGDRSYVNTPDGGMITVETGLSGDESTEIVSGLNEGDRYVVSTVSLSATTGSNGAASSLFGGGTTRSFGGGGTVRVMSGTAPAGATQITR